ncbi:MAG: hypothetical protein H0X64_07060 [Gemmatimonadaceae bacterium]|nr:hypothetical protein [Gemmatimonadaceae bacterium]
MLRCSSREAGRASLHARVATIILLLSVFDAGVASGQTPTNPLTPLSVPRSANVSCEAGVTDSDSGRRTYETRTATISRAKEFGERTIISGYDSLGKAILFGELIATDTLGRRIIRDMVVVFESDSGGGRVRTIETRDATPGTIPGFTNIVRAVNPAERAAALRLASWMRAQKCTPSKEAF